MIICNTLNEHNYKYYKKLETIYFDGNDAMKEKMRWKKHDIILKHKMINFYSQTRITKTENMIKTQELNFKTNKKW